MDLRLINSEGILDRKRFPNGKRPFQALKTYKTERAYSRCMACENKRIAIDCPCTYLSCSRHGHCCECVAYHRRSGELPGCYFTKEAERDYDRSIEHYLRTSRGEK